MSTDKAIEDSIMLADGKILNGTLWFIHSANSPYIGGKSCGYYKNQCHVKI